MATNAKRNFVRYLINGELANHNDIINETTLDEFLEEGYAPELSKPFIDYLWAENQVVENETLAIHLITRNNTHLFPVQLSCEYMLAQGNLSTLEQGNRFIYGRIVYVHISAQDIAILQSPQLVSYLRSLHKLEESIVMVVDATEVVDAKKSLELFNDVRKYSPFCAIFACNIDVETLYTREWDYEEPNLVITNPRLFMPEEFCDRKIEVVYDEDNQMARIEVYNTSSGLDVLNTSIYYSLVDTKEPG